MKKINVFIFFLGIAATADFIWNLTVVKDPLLSVMTLFVMPMIYFILVSSWEFERKTKEERF